MHKYNLTRTIQKLYPLLNCSNPNKLKKRVEAGELSRGKVRELVGLTEAETNIRTPTYLINNEDSFMVSATDNEGGHGLPLDAHALADQLHHTIKSVKCQRNNKNKNNYNFSSIFTKPSSMPTKGSMSMTTK